jgi:hypothetical protein
MADRPSTAEIRAALLAAGLAPGAARRAVLEIEDHYRQLLAEGIARGEASALAGDHAARRLGSLQAIVAGFAARPELLAWSRRWPGICFGLLPLLGYALLIVASLGLLLGLAQVIAPHLRGIRLAPEATVRIGLSVQVLMLWIFPLLLSIMVGVLANRRRARPWFPAIGILAIGILASLLNVDVSVTGGSPAGQIGAGIGLSSARLPQQLLHAIALTAIALVPLWRCSRRDREIDAQ